MMSVGDSLLLIADESSVMLSATVGGHSVQRGAVQPLA
jgi:hypothetical protein